ncbi:hypothetical protein EJ03DRAFT_222848 [Teratosphaeria nubilosa]|uniref:Uncharacterized protein n=1 Tax=Teratosphaeria nubilosa TaxID=161662 RepID=A0A6G1KX99_9PEZI|nr:hypothetical protein EJ03DRAFT_222848 [Teratosphaeria nubilosa]
MCCSNRRRRGQTPAMVSSMTTDKYQQHRVGDQAIAAGSPEDPTRTRASQDILPDVANDEIKGRVTTSVYPPRYEDVVVNRTAVFLDPESPGLGVAGQQQQGRWMRVPEPAHQNSASRPSLSSSSSDAYSLHGFNDVVDGFRAMQMRINGASADRKQCADWLRRNTRLMREPGKRRTRRKRRQLRRSGSSRRGPGVAGAVEWA